MLKYGEVLLELKNMQDLYADCSGELKCYTQWEVKDLIDKIYNGRKSAENRPNDDLGTAFLVANSLASSSYDSSSSSCGGD